MKWYHGTSKQNAERILKEGVLKPGQASTYDVDIPRSEAVYIADFDIANQYAIERHGVVLEVVQPNPKKLIPDEDDVYELLNDRGGELNAKGSAQAKRVKAHWLKKWNDENASYRTEGYGEDQFPHYENYEKAWAAWGEIEFEGSAELAEQMKELTDYIVKNDPKLAQAIITLSGKAAHLGPIKVVGQVKTAAKVNEIVKPVFFKIEVPTEHRQNFWTRPEGKLEFWAFKDRPRCFKEEKIIFTFDGKPVAEAKVLKIEAPGSTECGATGQYKDRHKVFWEPQHFKKLGAGNWIGPVYHGAIGVFAKLKGQPEAAGMTYFTDDSEYADYFASYFGQYKENSTVYPAYIKFSKPFDARGWSDEKITAEKYAELVGCTKDDLYKELFGLPSETWFWRFLLMLPHISKKSLMAQGYDGIMLLEALDKGQTPSTTSFVVFKDSQIKPLFDEKQPKKFLNLKGSEEGQPDVLYHLSRRTNRSSIKAKGLVPQIKEYKDIPREPGVFFFQTLEQAKDYGYWHAQFINQATDVWECHIPKEYKIARDPHPEMDFADAWRSNQTLAPENLKFVGTILVPTSKSRAPMKSTKVGGEQIPLYHGTTWENADKIKKQGIKATPWEFTPGSKFVWATTDYGQAESYGITASEDVSDKYAVVTFVWDWNETEPDPEHVNMGEAEEVYRRIPSDIPASAVHLIEYYDQEYGPVVKTAAVKTEPMDAGWRGRLDEVLAEGFQQRPDLLALRNKLLGFGGGEALAKSVDNPPNEVTRLMERGQFWKGRGQNFKKMKHNNCHGNSVCLMEKGLGSVVNGYALSKDGLWRQHSWVVTPEGGIIETTVRRAAYFGAVLNLEEVKAEYTNMASKTADHVSDEGFWAGEGNAASGVLPVCPAKGTVCLAMRSSEVMSPNCWGTIGGAIQEGLSPSESAKVEMAEETGYHGGISLTPAYVFTSGGFKYYNFIGVVGTEFTFTPNEEHSWETDYIQWIPYQEVVADMQKNPSHYHSGLLKLFASSKDAIERLLKIKKQASTYGVDPEVDAISKKYEQKGVSNYVSGSKVSPDYITLHEIVVPKDQRGEGLGSAFMEELAAYADRTGKTIVLTPDTSKGGSSVGRLREFYGRFGFHRNTGRNKDFRTTEAMLRRPKTTRKTGGLNFQPMSFEAWLNKNGQYHPDDPEEAKWRYEENVEHFSTLTFPVTIYRALEIEEGTEVNWGKLGESWTWVENSADAYFGSGSMWSPKDVKPLKKPQLVILKAQVRGSQDVDWDKTLYANMLNPDENEVTVTSGASLKILGVDYGKGYEKPKSQNVNASGQDVLKAYMSDLWAQTQANPFNGRERVFQNKAIIEAYPFDGQIHVSFIRSVEQGKGYGSEGLDLLIKLADKHGVEISLEAEPPHGMEVLSQAQLIKWYKRHGFKQIPNEAANSLIYKPMKALKLKGPMKTIPMTAAAPAPAKVVDKLVKMHDAIKELPGRLRVRETHVAESVAEIQQGKLVALADAIERGLPSASKGHVRQARQALSDAETAYHDYKNSRELESETEIEHALNYQETALIILHQILREYERGKTASHNPACKCEMCRSIAGWKRPWLTGKCHEFALALSEKMPDAQFVGIGSTMFEHVGLRKGDTYYDVRGAMTKEQFAQLFGSNTNNVNDITRERVMEDSYRSYIGHEDELAEVPDIKAAHKAVQKVFGGKTAAVQFREETRGAHHGQSDMTLTAEVDGKPVGYVEYSVYDGEPNVQYIKVIDQRKGYGRTLLKKLQSMFPETEVNLGMTTPDGSALVDALQFEEKPTEYAEKFKELEQLIPEKEKLEALAEQFYATEEHTPEEKQTFMTEMDKLNPIHDRIWELENELRGKSPSKRLITAEQQNLFPDSQDAKFTKWFSGSKVVDAEGRPLAVYHGTRSSADFDTFSVDGVVVDDSGDMMSSGSGADPTSMMGAHFAVEPNVANQFAEGKGWTSTRYEGEAPKPRVMKVYLRMVNPKDFGSEYNLREFINQGKVSNDALDILCRVETGFEPWEDVDEAAQKEIDTFFQKYDNDLAFRDAQNGFLLESYRPLEGEDDLIRDAAYELASQARGKLEVAGHDGIHYKNVVEGGTAWIAFDPRQVKSAWAQSYNPLDPRFTASKQASGWSGTVYHGTKQDFASFDINKAGMTDPGLVGKAVYFSDDPGQAMIFARSPNYGGGKGEPRVLAAKVNLNRPYYIEDGKLEDGRGLNEIHPNGIAKATGQKFQNWLKKKGYDGVVFRLFGEVAQVAVFDTSDIVITEPNVKVANKTAGFAFKTFKKLWHIGTLNPTEKQMGSMEGSGLSVSVNPNEWQYIARLSGDVWEFTKPGNKFLNFHRISKVQRQGIVAWGMTNGYVEPVRIFTAEWYDDEIEETRYSEYIDEAEAKEEAESMGGKVTVNEEGLNPTPKLLQRAHASRSEPTMAWDYLVTVYVEDELDCDGVWWQDNLDQYALSAPRGVIFSGKLQSWTKKKVQMPAQRQFSSVASADPQYYMEEGCGMFAVALALLHPKSDIKAISDNEGERWNESIPFELSHVYCSAPDANYDVKGSRSVEQMASELGMTNYKVVGSWDPKEFMKKFMGMGDKPLYGEKADVEEAKQVILANPEKYGLPKTAATPKPSTTQLDALKHMAGGKPLSRYPGGFWSTEPVSSKDAWGIPKNENGQTIWYVPAQTMSAMEKRGWIVRANKYPEHWKDDRVITDAGLLLLMPDTQTTRTASSILSDRGWISPDGKNIPVTTSHGEVARALGFKGKRHKIKNQQGSEVMFALEAGYVRYNTESAGAAVTTHKKVAIFEFYSRDDAQRRLGALLRNLPVDTSSVDVEWHFPAHGYETYSLAEGEEKFPNDTLRWGGVKQGSVDEPGLLFRAPEDNEAHDYQPSWDYMVQTHPDEELAGLASEAAKRIYQRTKQPFEVWACDLPVDAVAMYINGTCGYPVLLLDLEAHREHPDQFYKSIDHELKHAVQEMEGREFDEDEAEDDLSEIPVKQ